MNPDPVQGPRHRCVRCRHHFLTYDPRAPQGCRAFGFRSRAEPARIVEGSSGTPCAAFERRPAARGR